MATKKKVNRSARKGGSFERKIAKDLSLWWSDGKSSDLFWRTHASGSFGTNAKIKAEMGDLKALNEGGRDFMRVFNVECRTGKCIRVKDLIYDTSEKNRTGMPAFIKEGEVNARASNRFPLWIFREQGMPIMVMMKRLLFNRFTVRHMYDDWQILRGFFPRRDIMLFDYEEWKKIMDIKSIKAHAQLMFDNDKGL